MSDSQELSIFDASQLSPVQMTFCELVANRSTIEEAVRKVGWNAKQYYRMRHEQPAFDLAVVRAREMAQDAWVDKLPEIAQNEPDVQRARLLSDNVKWAAARIKPRAYGDRLDLNITQTIDIGSALAEARNRAALRPRCDPDNVIDGQAVDITGRDDAISVDKQSSEPSLPDIFE